MRKRMRPGVVAMAGLALAAGWAAPVRAAEGAEGSAQQCPICSKASNQSASYSSKAGTMLVRGASNTVLGWTELISQPVHEVKSGGNVFVGIGNGIGQTVTRTLAGVGEVLTFWTPKVNDRYIEFAQDCPVCMKRGQGQQ